MRSVLSFLLMLTSLPAFGYCPEPRFYGNEPSFSGRLPSFPAFLDPPMVPFCLSDFRFSGSHSCQQFELDLYFDNVSDYIDELNSHLRDVLAFSNDAVDFANEALAFVDDTKRHFSSAKEHVECLAVEVQSQHK